MEVNIAFRFKKLCRINIILYCGLQCVVQLKEIMHRHQKKGNDENGEDHFSYLFKTLRRRGIQS